MESGTFVHSKTIYRSNSYILLTIIGSKFGQFHQSYATSRMKSFDVELHKFILFSLKCIIPEGVDNTKAHQTQQSQLEENKGSGRQ